MSVFRKENGSLVKKAGRALVDLALSLTSNNAIANSAVTQEINNIMNILANKANKTDVILYPDVSQDFVLIGENITLNYVAPADGFVSFISDTNTPVVRTITINNKQVFQVTSAIIPVKRGQVVKSNDRIRIAHFTYSS